MSDTETTKLQVPEKKVNWFSESLLLAWIPLLAYFVAYQFREGYCQDFGVPTYLIDVNLETIFTSISVIAILLIIFKAFFESIISLVKFGARSAILSYVILLVLFGAWAILVKSWYWPLLWFGLVFAVVFITDLTQAIQNKEGRHRIFLFRMIGFRSVANEFVRQVHEFAPEADVSQNPALAALKRTYNNVFLIVILFLFASPLMQFLGDYKASSEEIFFISKNDPSLILMNITDGKAICSRINPATREVLRETVIVPLRRNVSTNFVERKLGKLVFRDPQ